MADAGFDHVDTGFVQAILNVVLELFADFDRIAPQRYLVVLAVVRMARRQVAEGCLALHGNVIFVVIDFERFLFHVVERRGLGPTGDSPKATDSDVAHDPQEPGPDVRAWLDEKRESVDGLQWLACDPGYEQLVIGAGDRFLGEGFRLAIPPGVEMPERGQLVEVTGHYDDPAARDCTHGTPPEESVLFCRSRFVVTSARPVER